MKLSRRDFAIACILIGLVLMALLYGLRWIRREFEGFKSKPVVTYYFMETCPHCKAFMPEWEKFKAEAASAGISTREYSINKDRAEVEKAEPAVEGFPTVHVEIDGKVSEYKGSRTAAALMEFVKSQ